jgi:hypothetical protein
VFAGLPVALACWLACVLLAGLLAGWLACVAVSRWVGGSIRTRFVFPLLRRPVGASTCHGWRGVDRLAPPRFLIALCWSVPLVMRAGPGVAANFLRCWFDCRYNDPFENPERDINVHAAMEMKMDGHFL